MANQLFNLDTIRRLQFDRAKFWWNIATTGKATSICLGVLLIVSGFSAANAAVIILVVAVSSELIQMWSDELKGKAEALHRKLELRDSFGWAVSDTEIHDSIADSPNYIKEQARLKESQAASGEYFASNVEPGYKRALDNFHESAWWSKRLAREVAIVYTLASTCAFAVILVVLILLTANSSDLGVPTKPHELAARVATACVLLLFSTGLIKTAWGYWKFSAKSENVASKLGALRLETALDDNAVFKVIEDYHLARAAAPMIPTWVWKRRQAELNELWNSRRG